MEEKVLSSMPQESQLWASLSSELLWTLRQTGWVQTPLLCSAGCVTWDNLLNLSGPQLTNL